MLVSTAMAFSLGTAAFAEQATPETAAQSEPAMLAQQAPADSTPAVQNNVENPAAEFVLQSLVDGQWQDKQRVQCATLQEAFDLAAAAEQEDNMLLAVNLMRDVTESITIPAYIPAYNNEIQFHLQGHNLTATNGPAITMGRNSSLNIDDWNGGAVINGGANSAIYCIGYDSCLNIYGGTFISETEVLRTDAGTTNSIWISGGTYSNSLPESVRIANGYKQVKRSGMYAVVKESTAVACTNKQDGTTTEYNSLQEAIDAAIADSSIYRVDLLNDVIASITVENASSYISLNLNGWTLTAEAGKPAVTVGAMASRDGMFGFFDTAGTGTVNGGDSPALYVLENTYDVTSANINGATLTAQSGPVAVAQGRIYIGGGTLVGAPAQPVMQYGTTQSSNNGVQNGEFWIQGGTLRAGEGGYLFAVRPGTSGETGRAICNLASGYGMNNELTTGTYYGDMGDVESLKNHLFIQAGTFDREVPDEVIAATAEQEKRGDMYIVKRSEMAAQVNGFKYKTVQDAVDNNGGKGETVTLLRDFTGNLLLEKGQTVTLDLNGHIMRQKDDGNAGVLVNNGTLTIMRGRVEGTFVLDDPDAVIYVGQGVPVQREQLSKNMDFGKDKVNGYTTILWYDEALAADLAKLLQEADAGLKNDGMTLDSITAEQLANAANMTTDGKYAVHGAYNWLNEMDETLVQGVLKTQTYAGYATQLENLKKLHDACWKPGTDVRDVDTEIDPGTVAAPKADNVPADKQPTAEDAEKAADKLLGDLTKNDTVNKFEDNGLSDAADLKKIESTGNKLLTFMLSVKLKSLELGTEVVKDDNGDVQVKLPAQKLVFEVEPLVRIDGDQDYTLVGNDKLNGSVTVRLPIPADVTAKYAKVVHENDADRYLEIRTAENGDKYVEFTVTHFSKFTVTFTNELPKAVEPAQPAVPVQGGTDATPAQSQSSTPAPAAKQDDSAYYTCKACGYHDWTAVDGGYKCNHCGYVESVKQLAGYPNVKGTAQVGKAATKTSAKTLSTIPQTSDDMPVAALAATAVAALLGLGVTAAAKRKHSK